MTYEELAALGPTVSGEEAAEALSVTLPTVVRQIREGAIRGAMTGEKRGERRWWANLEDVTRFGSRRTQRAAVKRAKERAEERLRRLAIKAAAEDEEAREALREQLREQLRQGELAVNAYVTARQLESGRFATFGEFCRRHPNARIRLETADGKRGRTLSEAQQLAYWQQWVTCIRREGAEIIVQIENDWNEVIRIAGAEVMACTA